MHSYSIRILQARKRLGLKEISAPSIEEAEDHLISLLREYFNATTSKVIYIDKNPAERKLMLLLNEVKLTVQLQSI